MIKKLLLVLAAFVTGLTAYFTIVQGIPITTLFTTLKTTIANKLQPITTLVQQNPLQTVGASIGAGVPVTTYLAKKVKSLKENVTNVTKEAAAWKNETFQMNTVTDKLLEENKDLKEQLKILEAPNLKIEELTNNLSEAQALVMKQQEQIKTLEIQKEERIKTISQSTQETINDLKNQVKRLKAQVKTVP